eukprot:Anaeramoba_ignava/a622908_69.p2 GENE.a622908_69~~a622908_69.p2  ORF type:complete len:151 (-),score=41.14 a622908_69:727-1179(-)
MGRSKETFQKKEVRNKKEKKRKAKAQKKLDKKENQEKSGLDDMIAYVDENGMLSDTPPEDKKEEIKAEDIELGIPKKQAEDEDPTRKGTVTFFNDSKGYGFIKDLETRESVFVHVNNCEDELKEGNKVSFEVEMGPRGKAAINVKLADKK